MLSVDSGGPRRRSVTSGENNNEMLELVQKPDQKDIPESKVTNNSSVLYQKAPWKASSTCLVLLAFVVSVVILLGGLGGQIARPATNIDIPQHETGRQLGITLHPEDHAYRPPKNIIVHWDVSAAIRSPDGVKKRVYLVNDEFPGPTIEARSGDELTVHVHNFLEDESISIHWHGLQVPNGMDGATGFTQCPIAPGGSFTYHFQIGAQHGTFWWHAHFQSQRGDGLYGGLVVHPPHEELAGKKAVVEYEEDVLLMVGDWFHRSSDEVLKWYTNPGNFGNEPVPDSILVNGAGRYDCALAVPARPVEVMQLAEDMVGGVLRERVPTRLRLVNTGTIAGFTIAIDGASLEAVAVDASMGIAGVPAVSIGIVYPGERVDAVLRWVDPSITEPRMNITLDNE
jgi:FtsP/CotA-like multicopper oxidase with cupredoxin domain